MPFKSVSIDSYILSQGVITKRQLAQLLGLINKHQTPRYAVLNHRFDIHLLTALNITRDQYSKLRVFDTIQTRIIIKRFQLHTQYPDLDKLIQ